MSKILVVDDDPHILDVVDFALQRAGHEMVRASDGDEALVLARTSRPDLVVLDVGLPKQDGLAGCRAIRADEQLKHVPILFLSARDEEVDRIIGLEMGADDYVTKPFSPRELAARVAAILRRSSVAVETQKMQLSHGCLHLDLDCAQSYFGEQELSLTAQEISILKVLMARPGHVFDRGRILDFAYPGNIHVSDRTIDSHIRNVRAKFAACGCKNVVETVPRMGFRLGACTGAKPSSVHIK